MNFSLLTPLVQEVQQRITTDGGFLFPAQGTAESVVHDQVFMYLIYIAGFFFLLINAAAIYFAVKYHRSKCPEPQPSPTHNNTLEIVWTVIPTLICVWLFYIGVDGFIKRTEAPEGSYEIQVMGQKWSWTFTYPNGAVSDELHAPSNTNVRLIIQSRDVLHSVWIPEFRIKQDAVPGRYTETWFNSTIEEEFTLKCTEYCGTEHSGMYSKVVIQSPDEFEQWLKGASNPYEGMTQAEMGEKVLSLKGCMACHTTDGSAGIGPGLKGAFGNDRKLTDGTSVTFDENYIRESILSPATKVAEGYTAIMPVLDFEEEEVAAIIAYIKSIK
jgi:cytochrome c oxidase subunit II